MKPRPALLIPLAFLAFISLGLPDAVLGVAWPSIRRTFGLSLTQLPWLIAFSMAGYLTSTAAAGTLVQRLGVGPLLLVSSVLVVVSLAGFALSPWWWPLLLCGTIGGLGAGAIDAGINAYAAERFSPRVVSWLHASYGIGATLGPVLMTAVLSARLQWRWGYAALAGVLLLMSTLFFMMRGLWDGRPRGLHADEPAAGATALEALAQQRVQLNILLFFLYTGTEVAAVNWLFSLLNESRGMPTRLAGACVSLFWGALTSGRILSGFAAHHFPGRLILRAGLAIAPVGALLLSLRSGPGVAFAAAALLGFALAPIYPMLISDTPDRVGQRFAAQSIGFQVAAAYVGAAALPAAVAVLSKLYRLEVLGPFLLGCTLALLILHELSLRLAGCTVPAASPAAGVTLPAP
jgi:fucose permease